MRQYGDVPFTDHVLTTAEVNSLERRPAKEIFDFIISECDEIKDLIIENYENLGGLGNRLMRHVKRDVPINGPYWH